MERHAAIRLLDSRTLYRGPIFDLIQERLLLPSGRAQDLVVVDHPGAVCVAPLCDDGRLLLVRQYRHATGDWLLEIPAGRREPGEEPLAAAQRELEEETGQRARSWRALRSFFPAPGFCSEVLDLFLATELSAIPGGGAAADDDEELELVRLAPAEVLREARDAKTLVAALLVLRELEADGRAASTMGTVDAPGS